MKIHYTNGCSRMSTGATLFGCVSMPQFDAIVKAAEVYEPLMEFVCKTCHKSLLASRAGEGSR